MGRLLHFLACFGWQAAWWLAWFLLFGVGLSLCGQPTWLALPAGLLVGGAQSVFSSRKEAETAAAPRFRRAGKALPLCLSIGSDPGSLPFPAGEKRAGNALPRHIPLPFAWRRRDEREWRESLRKLPPIDRGGRTPACLLLHLSARWLAERGEEAILKKARFLRARLNALEDVMDASLSVFLLVDGIDRLYGWPTLAALLPEERLGKPLGAVRGDGGDAIDSLLGAVTAEAAGLVFSPAALSPANAPAPSPARLQAFPEFRRVAERLSLFTKQLSNGRTRDDAAPRGVFFGSFLPGLSPHPPFAADASFIPAEEPPFRRESLFFDRFFSAVLPEALRRGAGGRRAPAPKPRGALLHCAATGMLVAALCVGWLMTWSFLRTRNILLSAAGAAAHPETPGQLAGYLRLAERTAASSAGTALPRFGMTEDRTLAEELKRRFSESYHDLKTIPGIERLQNAALDAVRSGDPRQLGNALVMLVITRDAIAGAMGERALPEESRALLRGTAVSLGLTSEDELRQLGAFLEWAGGREWMPEVREALARFERHIAESDPLGGWAPQWADSIPGAARTRLPRAWTRAGYAAVKALAEAAAPAENGAAQALWRESVLGEYRKNALAAWRGAAAAIWNGFPGNVPDAEIPARLRRAAEGRDPASSFAALACEHLLPMYEGAESGGDAPEIAWLRLRLRLERAAARAEKAAREEGHAAPETGTGLLLSLRRAIAASAAPGGAPETLAPHFIAWENRKAPPGGADDPVSEATRLAKALAAFLDRHAGKSLWPALSPLATDRAVRHLLARQAALQLDDLWFRTVYTPCRLIPGGDASRRLERFLTGAANGFWTWRGDALANARWNAVPFTFSREFLAFCDAALEDARIPALKELPLVLDVSSVNASGDRVLERPTAVAFRLGSGDGGQTITYRNYPVSGRWIWTPGIAEAEIQVVFPSHTAAIRFSGPEGIRNFSTLFSEGSRRFDPEDFGDSAETLRRLGIASLTVNASLTGAPELIRQLSRKQPPPLPKSILSK